MPSTWHASMPMRPLLCCQENISEFMLLSFAPSLTNSSLTQRIPVSTGISLAVDTFLQFLNARCVCFL